MSAHEDAEGSVRDEPRPDEANGGEEDSVTSPVSMGVAPPESEQLYEVLRLIADTQRKMSEPRGPNKSRVLSSIKLPEFDGSVTMTIRHYR